MMAHIHYTIYNIHYILPTAIIIKKDSLVLFTIYCYWMSSHVGCAGVQHWLLPTSPSRHPSGGVCSHGLVLVSHEMRSLSIYATCIQHLVLL